MNLSKAVDTKVARLIPYVLVLVLWIVGFFAAQLLEYAPHASLWFPPAAITFAALIVLGLRALPAIVLACVLGTFLIDWSTGRGTPLPELLLLGTIFALTHSLSNLFVALPLRRMAGRSGSPTSMPKVALFLLGAAIATGLGAAFGVWSLILLGDLGSAAWGEVFSAWWIGDYVALLALTPLIVVLLVRVAAWARVRIPKGISSLVELRQGFGGRAQGKLATMLLISAAVLFAAGRAEAADLILFLLFVSLLLQLWIVHTESAWVSVLGVSSFGLLSIVATAIWPLEGQVLMLKFVVISLAASGYLGLAVPSLYSDNARLRGLLTHDALTGVLNRAFFEDAVRNDLRLAADRDQAAVLIMADLDKLKSINDQFGHAAGDRALSTLAEVCREVLRPSDLIGRLSGDEFAIFLPQQDAGDAAACVRSIEQKLGERTISRTNPAVSASFGWAQRSATRADYESLLALADQAMYAAKRSQVT